MGDVKKCIKMLNWLTGDVGDVPTGPGTINSGRAGITSGRVSSYVSVPQRAEHCVPQRLETLISELRIHFRTLFDELSLQPC